MLERSATKYDEKVTAVLEHTTRALRSDSLATAISGFAPVKAPDFALSARFIPPPPPLLPTILIPAPENKASIAFIISNGAENEK